MRTSSRVQYEVATGTVLLPALDEYRVVDATRLLTPALLVYPEYVEANLSAVVDRIGGDASRWRAHVKTAKLPSVIRQMLSAGVSHLKCATTLELLTACEAGARDVLLAYPLVGPKVRRVQEIARAHPDVTVSALVEDEQGVSRWKGANVGLFVDVNAGMDRTGIPDTACDRIAAIARGIVEAGLRFGGLHYYDGHVLAAEGAHACQAAHRGYDRLLALVATLDAAGITVPEIITAGTPGLPCSLSYAGFKAARPVHRVSPGTIVYNDASTAWQLPADWDLRPAAIVAATVVSHPTPGRITCDAGHKTVSADAGVPTCVVLGRPDLQPLKPSEEHLPIAVSEGAPVPAVGEILYLVPRHVCPTVNSFDHAVLVRGGAIAGVERVAARGREAPLT